MSTSTAAAFNKTRVAFMQRASAPSIPPHALKLAYLLAFKYMNRQSRTTFVGQDTLAGDLNVSVRTVQRLLDLLQPLGLVIVPGDGRGRASTYWLDPERVTSVSSFPARKGDNKGRQPATKKGDTRVAPTLLKGTKILARGCYAPPEPVGESPHASRADLLPVGGSPPLTRRPAEKDGSAEAEPGATKEENRAATGAQREAAFAELRGQWRRGWASDDTPKALAIARATFAKACAAVDDPDEILAGARTWISGIDAARYLPALADWLAARGWEKPPPTRARRAPGDGHPHGGNGRRPYGRKPDFVDIGQRLAAKYAAERAEREIERAVS